MMLLIKQVHFEEMREEKGLIQATFSRPVKPQGDLLIDLPIKTSSYTFNVPLTWDHGCPVSVCPEKMESLRGGLVNPFGGASPLRLFS